MKYLVIFSLLINSAFALTGLKVGDKNPLDKLTTIDGKVVDLNGDKTTVLVFYRGSWCPYCVGQLKNIKSYLHPRLKKAGINLIAVSVDKKKVGLKMKRNFSFTYDIVSDVKGESLKAFNIVNKLNDELVVKYKNSYGIDIEGDSGEKHHMIAHPGVFIVKGGKITFADVHEDYKQRTDNKKIIEALGL